MTDKELKELKDTLWHSADVLRASAHLAANKYGQPILGLIFLRYADILYKQHKEEIEAEYNHFKGGRMEKSKKEISIEKCGFYLPECAYYDFINDAPDDANKATLVKKAMEEIEKENPKMEGVLPKDVYAQLVPEEEPELLSNIVRIFKDIPENSTIDIFGEIYEYFLGNFALAEGKDGGTFYTPATVVRYMVEVLNPQPGEKKFLDPACGSGGMFVQAALVMANSASDASGSEYDIRKKMIEEGIISQMVTLPSNMFSSVTLPATLWFFDKQKPYTEKKNEILFIDARNVFTQVDRSHRKFSDEQIKNLGVITKLYHGDTQALVDLLDEYKCNLENAPDTSDDIQVLTKDYWQTQIDWLTERFPDGVYADVIGLCKAAPMDGEDGIIDQDYSLNAGRYVGVVIEDDGLTQEEFKEEMYSLNAEFTALSAEAKKLEELISNNLKELLGE